MKQSGIAIRNPSGWWSAGCCLAALLGLWVGPAAAEPIEIGEFELHLTESLYVDWHQDNENGLDVDDRYVDVKNRLNIALQSRWLQAGLRLDVAQFLPQNKGDEGDAFSDRYQNDLNLEKFYVKVREGGFLLEGGDVYGILGKGIALSIQKVDELSTDATLRGAKAMYRGRGLTMMALGGYSNIVNVGDRVEEYIDDPKDLIGGAQIGFSPIPEIEFSAHTSYVKDRIDWATLSDRGDYARDHVWVTGALLQLPNLWDIGSFLIEYDYVTFEQVTFSTDPATSSVRYPVDPSSGHVVYATGSASYWLVHALAEFKYYDGVGQGMNSVLGKEVRTSAGGKEFVYYGVLPPLEDPSLFLRPTYYDQWGARLRVDVEIPDTGTMLFVNYAHFDDLDEHETEMEDQSVRHVTFGVEQRLDEYSAGGSLQAGRRWDHLQFEWDRTMSHLDAEVHFPVGGPFSVEASGRMEYYDEAIMDDFTLAKSSLTLSMASLFSVSGTYEFADQPPVGDSYYDRNFWAGELLWRFASDSYAKIFVGTTRGGLKCAGGMCRIFPPFEGVKGEVTLRF